MIRRIKDLLPNGTLLVGSGIALLGIAAYVQLAVAGHDLPQDQMASLAVLWSIVFAVAPGLFLPLEQELTRLVADRRASDGPTRPVFTKALAVVCGAAVLFLIVALVAQGPIARVFFGGDRSLVWITCISLVVHAGAHASRGVLAGLGRFGWYGGQLAIDGTVRLIGTAFVAMLATADVAMYAWVLVVAPALSLALTMTPIVRSAAPGEPIADPIAEPITWPDLSRRLSLLTASAFLNQLMINIAVINAQLLSHGDSAISVALLSAMVMARVPVFLFGSIHAALLAGATTAVARRAWASLWLLVRRTLLVVTSLVALTSLILVPAGSILTGWLFNAPDVLNWGDFLLLGIGVAAYLWSFVFGQVVVALHRHGLQALCWAAGTAVLAGVSLLPLEVSLRVELGFVGGALTTAVLLGAVLRAETRARQQVPMLVPEVAHQ